MVLRRELGGNAVDEKSVAVGIGEGYQEDLRWAKKSTPLVRGGILKNHLSCTVILGDWNVAIWKTPPFLSTGHMHLLFSVGNRSVSMLY